MGLFWLCHLLQMAKCVLEMGFSSESRWQLKIVVHTVMCIKVCTKYRHRVIKIGRLGLRHWHFQDGVLHETNPFYCSLSGAPSLVPALPQSDLQLFAVSCCCTEARTQQTNWRLEHSCTHVSPWGQSNTGSWVPEGCVVERYVSLQRFGLFLCTRPPLCASSFALGMFSGAILFRVSARPG